jgi:antitoxin HicB
VITVFSFAVRDDHSRAATLTASLRQQSEWSLPISTCASWSRRVGRLELVQLNYFAVVMGARWSSVRQRRTAPSLRSGSGSISGREGMLAACRAGSSKELLTRQLHQAMKKKKLSKNKMAARMDTSRAQLDRLLDPKQGNVTLETLHRAAQVLGRELRIELT